MNLPLLAALLCVPSQEAAEAAPAERLQDCLQAFVTAGGGPGISAGIVLADGTTYALAAGTTERKGGRALAPGDRLLAGSVGKTFVSAVALQLVAEERLDLDLLVGELLGDETWFEHLPNAYELTLRQLLGHRSGLPRYVFQPAFVRDLTADPDRVWKPAELLAYIFDQPPLFEAGAGFAYSDTNYLLVAMCIEVVTDSTLYAQVQERLLDPLELAGVVPSDRRVIPGLVQGHCGDRDPLGLPDLTLDAEGRFVINPQFEWAGGGFATTGGDLARWAHALYAGDVLDSDRRALLITPAPAPELGRGVGYGLGAIAWPNPGGPSVGHSGFFPGYLTELHYWPAQRIAVAVQVNTSDGRALPRSLAALCGQLLEIARAR